MTTTFNLPDLGEGLQEAEIVEWKVKEGDIVAVDDPLVAVETDKAVVDVPSPYAGKISKLHWKNGDIVPTHSALVDFDIDGEGEAPEAAKPAPQESRPAPKAAKAAPAEPGGGKTFNLPDLGEGLQEAEIVEWKVSVGDTVGVDDPLVAVETDKAVVDVPSPYAGTILKLHWNNGDVVPTHSPLVDFAVEGESTVAEDSTDTREKGAEKEGKGDDSGTVVGKMATSDEELEDNAVIRKKGGRRERGRAAARTAAPVTRTATPQPKNITHGTGKPKASPATRAYAKECGCDLTRVEGTGSKGQITKADVDRFMQSGGARPAQQAAAPMAYAGTGPQIGPWDVPAPSADVEYDKPMALKGPRRAMHNSMTASRSQVVECTLFDDADIHAWMPGQDITARIIRAVVVGCRAVPQMNAWYNGEKMERTIHSHVDLAMAVDTPDGLIVPVIRKADTKNGQQLREELNSIKEKTRNRTVAPEEMKNPTITLSNFGMMAGRYATPVVVPPQVAILGTGGLRHDVVAVMGGVETHRRIPLSITFDHRCLTGGEACRWLAAVIKDLEKSY